MNFDLKPKSFMLHHRRKHFLEKKNVLAIALQVELD